jgi:hypothetical protein
MPRHRWICQINPILKPNPTYYLLHPVLSYSIIYVYLDGFTLKLGILIFWLSIKLPAFK